jgi:hypothetical protein
MSLPYFLCLKTAKGCLANLCRWIKSWKGSIGGPKHDDAVEHRLPDGNIYPDALIPQPDYRGEIGWTELLEQVPEVEVIRRADLPFEETFTEEGRLRIDAIPYKRVPGMSLHMPGEGLQTEDIRFKQKGPAGVTWQAGTPVEVAPLLAEVETQSPYCPIFFRAKDLHDQAFPYRRSG